MIDPHLPLLDLHRHLDGNIRAATILELGQRFNMVLPASCLLYTSDAADDNTAV